MSIALCFMILNIGLLRNNVYEMNLVEIKILRQIIRNTRKYRILRNAEVCLRIGVTLIDNKIRESCSTWFDQVKMREINALVRMSDSLDSS